MSVEITPKLPPGYDVAAMVRVTLRGDGWTVQAQGKIPPDRLYFSQNSLAWRPEILHQASFALQVPPNAAGPVTLSIDRWGILVPGAFQVTGLAKACKGVSLAP